MEEIHHVEVKGHATGLRFTVALPEHHVPNLS